jgi:iron uptake system EfeUOB component EfeO/EfeM
MKSFKPMLIIASISLLTLVGCNKPEQAATETTPAATSNSTEKVPGQKSTVSNAGLLAVVSKTKTAVKAGNFVQAKKEFDKFEDAWKEVEDGIKAKSRNNYEAVEKSMDEISGELKAAKPQKDKLLASLQSLEKTINAISKS